MQVVLRGSLDRFPLSQVLLLLGGNRHSGTLDVGAGGDRTRLYFEEGTIVGVDASGQPDPREAVLKAFERGGGEFVFFDGIEIPEGAGRLSLDVESIVAEAAQRATAGYPDDLVMHVVANPGLQKEITLSPEELRLLMGIGSGKSVGALAAASKGRRELIATLKRLQSAGLLVSKRAAAAAPPPARSGPLIGAFTADDGDVHPLVDAEYTIGRDPANAIPITDASVSSRHARIAKSAEGFVLEDLNSRNGTFVNGEKLTGRRTLVSGDVVRFGKIIFTFQLADSAAGADDTHAGAGKTSRGS
ncbi:MAG TPA: FHA domain-containing protein [Thermoanaerobaculia bacterium]|nr:FHA domain-containing protein [Thermoanaerobaculia bacterium]